METKSLLWLIMAFVFSIVLLLQYFETPYGYISPSLLSFDKSQAMSNGFNSEADKSFNFSSGVSNNYVGHNSSTRSFSLMNHNSSGKSVFSKKSPVPDIAIPISIYDNTSEKSSLPGNLEATKNSSNVLSSEFLPTNGSTRIQSQSTSSAGKDPANMLLKNENCGPAKNNMSGFANSSPVNISNGKKRRFKGPPAVVLSISEMNNVFVQSRASYQAVKAKWPSQADEELLNTRRLIEDARIMEKNPHVDVNVYRNYSEFTRSYELMKKTLKIYIYTEGEKPVFHQPGLDGIYASEGWFMKLLQENKHFVTKKPNKAHLFYLPFSSRLLEETLYVPNSHSRKNLVQYLSRYLQNVTTAYRFWNRTGGADHFIVACHDWAPAETSRIMKNCIRSLCNADAMGGFKFGKDVSLPETYIRHPSNPLKNLGGKPPSQRTILAFFAGKMHGYLRPLLLKNWENKDPDMKIFRKLNDSKGQEAYSEYMKSSKYCISARGYEPYTPRVVEAIFYECVPVILSDNYVPPFFETLNWESFAVFVLEKDISNLKTILSSISEERYAEMQERVRRVQKHFLWHNIPIEHDVFHMILHSVWYTRVFQAGPG